MSKQTNQIYEFGAFHLDAQERLLSRDGLQSRSHPRRDLLLALIRRSGRLVEKEELFQEVCRTRSSKNRLSSNIALIRKALGDGTNGERYIETVPKRGYRFVAGVQEGRRVSEVAEPLPEQAALVAGTVSSAETSLSKSKWKKAGALSAVLRVCVALFGYGL